MGIMLGNLTISQIEERTGVKFSKELKQLMGNTHQSKAENIADGKWHCFDMPFTLLCGGMPLAQEIYDHLKTDSDNFKEQMQISIA